MPRFPGILTVNDGDRSRGKTGDSKHGGNKDLNKYGGKGRLGGGKGKGRGKGKGGVDLSGVGRVGSDRFDVQKLFQCRLAGVSAG